MRSILLAWMWCVRVSVGLFPATGVVLFRRHTVCRLETFYWLDRCGYGGWLSMDQYPYREDAAGAIGESILWLVKFDSILQRKRAAIDTLVADGDAVKTSAFLRSVLA
jgi:hypothetical protein